MKKKSEIRIKSHNIEDKFSEEIETLKKYRNIGNEKLNINSDNKRAESISKTFDQLEEREWVIESRVEEMLYLNINKIYYSNEA